MLVCNQIYTQAPTALIQQQIDSISVLINQSNSKNEKLQHIFHRGMLYQNAEHTNLAKKDFLVVFNAIDIDENVELYAGVSLKLGRVYQHSEVFILDSALYYNQLAYEHYDKLPSALKLECQIRLMNVNYALFQFEEATAFCLECINMAKKVNDINNLRFCYTRMAAFSIDYLNDPSKVIEYSNLALNLLNENDSFGTKAYYYLMSADDYCRIGLFDEGLSFLDSCKKYIDLGGIKHTLVDYYLTRGDAYMGMNQYEFSQQNYQKAWRLADSINLWNRKMHAPMNLAELALKQRNYRKAADYAHHALEVIPEKLTLYELDKANKQLYLAYKGLKDYDKALHYFEIWTAVKDSSDQINNVGVIAGLERKYQSEQQQQQIEQQQEKINIQDHQRNLIIYFLLAIVLILIGLVYFFIKMKHSNAKIKKQNLIITRQSDKLHELDKVKSRFFANVSHELRTPLTLMLGPISSIIKRGKLDNRDFTFLATAKQNGQNLLKLVSSILDLSKMESGKIELNEKPVILFTLLRRLVASFESYAERQGIKFTFVYQGDKNLELELDEDKLEVILNNLLSNALKFTNRGGEIIVKIADEASHINISVVDTGRGIHQEDLNHVFDRFYQSNQADALIEGGTGIGLALSREFAKLMNGQLSVKSELGRGSTFLLKIPRKEILRMKIAPIQKEIIKERKLIENLDDLPKGEAKDFTILIVEDNHSLRDYLHIILAPYYNILTAENGQAAWKIASNNNTIHLVLSDVMMPVMDGYQLLTKLKSSDRFSHLPVVMLTARADVKDKLKALRIGVDDYLLKPFEEEELLVRIENLLKNYNNRITRKNNKQVEKQQQQFSEDDLHWLENCEGILEEKIGDAQFSMKQLAILLAMSESTLARQLKRITGLTPAKYLQEMRLNQARNLLENEGDLTIREIAFKIGYDDPKAFSKLFKKRFGKSPTASNE